MPVGPPQPWAPGETTSLAWHHFKRCWGVLVSTYVVATLIAELPQQAPLVAVMAHVVERNSSEYWVVYGVSAFVGFAVQMVFQPGLIRIWLSVARGGTPGFGDMFVGVSRFLPLFVCMLLNLLAVFAGYVLLFVPGIIVALGLALAQFYVIDASMGPIEALRASWKATKGHKANLFVFALIGGGLLLLGLVMCCFGFLVTSPIVWVGLAIVYVRLSGRGWATAAYAPQGPPGPGGWTPGAPPPGGAWPGY